MKNVGTVIRESANRRQLYASIFDSEQEVRHLQNLCPTRWCVRGLAVKRALDNFEEIRSTLAALAEYNNMRIKSQVLIIGCSIRSKK